MEKSTDMMIFVTGVVGRSMGSGKFEGDDIDMLTQRALDAFQTHLAPRLAQSPPLPRPSPGASQGPQRASWKAGPAAVASGGDVPPETKSLSVWGGDKAYLFEDNERVWGDWLGAAQDGDPAAREALEKAARAKLGDDPKWHKNNARRIARAKACLALLDRTQSAPEGQPYDQAPF
jgi:hypothetical protein